MFAIHEDKLVWNENVFKDYHGLLPGIHRFASVYVAFFHASSITRLPSVNVGDSRSINRHCTNYGIVLVFSLEPHRGHDNYPVRVNAAGLMGFCACDVDSLCITPSCMDKKIWVLLLRW